MSARMPSGGHGIRRARHRLAVLHGQMLGVATAAVVSPLPELRPRERESFREAFFRDGFVLVRDVLSLEFAVSLRDHYADLFAGRFPTGVYPDEWHWREGISMPDKVREIVNGWKSSPLVAQGSLNARIGKVVAQLMGWEKGTRLAQDSLLWKPAGSGGVAYHTDGAYISSNFRPEAKNSVTCWIALEDADAENGVVEYAVGSHLWPAELRSATDSAFHGGGDAYASVRAAAKAAGKPLEIKRLSVPCGCAVLHHQDVWHGSGPNNSKRPRRALAAHLLRSDVALRSTPSPDYIYGRYALCEGCEEVSEQFFPVIWSPDGHVSPIARRLLSAGQS